MNKIDVTIIKKKGSDFIETIWGIIFSLHVF